MTPTRLFSLVVLSLAGLPSCGTSGRVQTETGAEPVQLKLSGATLGERRWAPDRCSSGQRYQFFGVDLTARAEPATRVRVLEDPVEGPRVVVSVAGRLEGEACEHCSAGPRQRRLDERKVVLTAAQCRVFDIELQQDNTSVNDIVGVYGHARLDCAVEGTTVAGWLRFSGCH